MLNVAVAEISLQRPRVVPLIGERVATGKDTAANSLTALRDFSGFFESLDNRKAAGGGRLIGDPRVHASAAKSRRTRAQLRAHNVRQYQYQNPWMVRQARWSRPGPFSPCTTSNAFMSQPRGDAL
jgi:hypothetical protein